MSCMAAEDHDRIVRRVNLWHVKFHLIWAVLLALAIYLPYHLKLERDLLQVEYSSVKMKYRMLEMLRTRPLTIGQAMEITNAVIQQNKIPVEVVFAIMRQESEFTPEAVSKKGAKGLMQVMPVIWKSYSLPHFKNVTDPIQNVHVGTLYLADLFDQFGDWKAVFRAYYAGPQNYNNKNYDWYANAVVKKIADYRREMEN
ncbi:MAG: lytic transglycosylase domain-containing protein [Thermodesulfobacteriota bacterium]